MRDATRLARRYIVEDGLGAYVESHSVTVDAQLKESIIKASSSGFVYDFSVVKVISPAKPVRIHAKGRVSEKAVAQAIKYRYAEIGKPRLVIFFQEKIAGTASPAGRSITAAKLVARFADFQFVDTDVTRRLQSSGVYADSAALASAVEAARAADADFIVVGETEVEQGPPIEGTSMFTIKAHVRFRIVNVEGGVIIAEAADTYTVPFVNARQGAVPAIERAVEAMHTPIIEQIGSKWEPGQTIRIVFENITYDAFTDLGIVETMRKWERIGSVQDRGKGGGEEVTIEVEALVSGADLYRLMRSKRAELGVELSSREIKGNRLRLRVDSVMKR